MRRKQLKIPRSLDLASCPNEEHRSVTRWSPPRTHSRNISVDAFHSTADRYYPNQPGGNHNKNVSHVGEPSCFTPPHDAIDDKSGGFQHSGGVSSSGASSFGANFVMDHIYVGSFSDAMQYRELAVRNIQFILNVAVECDTDPREENLHHTYADLTFRYCKVPFVDGYWCDEICSGHLRTALTFIYRAACANACVLVHCSRGISRSPMVVLGYLVSKYGWNVQHALDHVQSRRENACPALCFILGLEDIFVTPVARAKLWSEVCTLENTPSTPSFHRPLLPIEECSASGSVQEIVRVQAITEYISVAISTPIQHSHPVLT